MATEAETERFENAYRALGYEIGLTHAGKISSDDARSLLRAIYEKRARMAELISDLEHALHKRETNAPANT